MPDIKIAELLVNVGSNSSGINWGDFFTTIVATFLGAGLAFGTNWYFESKKYKQRFKDEEERKKQENLNHLSYANVVLASILSDLFNLKQQFICEERTMLEFKSLEKAIHKGRDLIQEGKGFRGQFKETFQKLFIKILVPQYMIPVEIRDLSFVTEYNSNVIMLFHSIFNQIKTINEVISGLNLHLSKFDTNVGEREFVDFELLWAYRRNLEVVVNDGISHILLLYKCLNKIAKLIDNQFKQDNLGINDKYNQLIPKNQESCWENLEKWADEK